MQSYQLPDQTAKFAPVSTTILKIRAIFVHQTLTEHALYTEIQSVSFLSFTIWWNREKTWPCWIPPPPAFLGWPFYNQVAGHVSHSKQFIETDFSAL